MAWYHSPEVSRSRAHAPNAVFDDIVKTFTGSDDAGAAERELLLRAATERDVEGDDVVSAMQALEALKPSGDAILASLGARWRLVFTTGDKKTEKNFGRISYVPIKAIQEFDPKATPMAINNGVYLGDSPALQFTGDFKWDSDKRLLEFDFYNIELFGNDITGILPEFIRDGAGLTRDGLEFKKRPSFTFFVCDGKILVGRGAGGGLALWINDDSQA